MIRLGDKINLSYMDDHTGDIYLGYEFKCLEGWLNEEEYDELLSDVITHEFIHSLLLFEFDKTACKLFDAVEHHIGNFALKTKVFAYIYESKDIYGYPVTWHHFITKSGIDRFFSNYHLSKDNVNQAFILCNSR